ncbi:MAG: hypothetical protein Athens101426_200 [Parcubacteria group bacterium Athens1014_26]|nr:MAG: hypothetical protein Athens101426_200 [Parcubacteria group bacterium Athens1014_26]
MDFFKKNKPILFLSVFLIIIIASFLRLYNLTVLPPGLYPDEAMNGNNALEALSTNNFKIFYPENNGREGLFINIQAMSIHIFGNFSWVLRLISAIFGILTVLGVYFFTKELFRDKNPAVPPENKKGLRANEIIALLSSFFMAVSFWHINFSRIGFRAIMAPAFLVWAIYLLIKSLRQTKNNFQFSIFNFQNWILEIRNWILPAVAGLIYGLGFNSYIAYRATPLLIGIIFFILWRDAKRRGTQKIFYRLTAIFIAVSFLTALPLGLYFLKNPADFFGRTTQISIFSSPNPVKSLVTNVIKTAGMFNVTGDGNWRHNYNSQPELFWPVGILFLIGIIIAVIKIFKKNKSQNPDTDYKIGPLILFSWLVVTALPVIVSNEGIPHALRAIIMIPPVFILAGLGTFKTYKFLYKYFTFKSLFKFNCFLFLALLFLQAYATYFILWGKNPNTAGAFSQDYVDMANQLKSLPPNIPKYIIVRASGTLVRGIPMPTQTIMFLTDTFTPEKQKQKNIYYVLPDQAQNLPANSYKIILN